MFAEKYMQSTLNVCVRVLPIVLNTDLIHQAVCMLTLSVLTAGPLNYYCPLVEVTACLT